ncbi:hypothetical protein WDU94_007958 [Cyamophila willieti]
MNESFGLHLSGGNGEMSRTKICEANLTMEIAQLLLSLLHAWGLDPDLDKVCEGKLGLLRPMVPVSFGVVSKAGELKSRFDLMPGLVQS